MIVYRHPTKIIYIKERNLAMLKSDLILRNPLKILADEKDYILPSGGCGAVIARAGVGKTAFLVQLALHALLSEKNVLHISLKDAVDKVTLWYLEVFRLIADQYEIKQTDPLWDSILPHRFIMTFKVEGFSAPKLEERLTDLTEQDIFQPDILIIDGLPFDTTVYRTISDMRNLTEKHSLRSWFTVRTHRDDPIASNSIPSRHQDIRDLFDAVLQLQPEGKEIHIKAIKGGQMVPGHSGLILDPATMLIKNRGSISATAV